jgi:hypothetical protein
MTDSISSDKMQKKVEELAVKAVEIVKRLAHESVNAETKRRAHIRKAIDQIAGDLSK